MGDASLPQDDNRRRARSNVFLSAFLVTENLSVSVRVRDLSAMGALLEGVALPSAGTSVRLLRGELWADAKVVWEGGNLAGVQFSSEVEVERWLKAAGAPARQRIDSAILALRAGSVASPRVPDRDTATVSQKARDLEGVCERLASSVPMSVALGEELARLEALARSLERIAGSS